MRVASVSLILSALALGQATAPAPNAVPPSFDVADVHVSPKLTSNALNLSGTGIRGGRYEMHRATLLDLIRLAYSIDNDKILGGPTWLEINHYEILAKSPASSPPETVRLMLRSLLADRFKLVLHTETSDLPGFALTAPKKPQLKQSDGSTSPGCRTSINQAAQQAAARANAPDGAPVQIVPLIDYNCHSVTMKTFAEGLRVGIDSTANGPIVDRTGIEGVWDVSLQFTLPVRNPPAGAATVSLANALDKLGFKLETTKVPTPVIHVDSANDKPTDNIPGVEANFPPEVSGEFDVADIRPSDPATGNGSSLGMQPGGRLVVRNLVLQTLVTQAFGANIDDIVGAPRFLNTVRYDIIAKANVEGNQAVSLAAMRPLLLALLKDRFKLAYHTEERQVTAYNLTAPKPKLQKGDPTNRTACRQGTADPNKPSPVPVQILKCQNITMSQFADELLRFGNGYIRTPVLDMTNLAGAWDFSFSFSPQALVNGTARIATNDPNASPSDPTGAISLFDALGKLGLKLEPTKRPAQVFVIDHIEEKPTEN